MFRTILVPSNWRPVSNTVSNQKALGGLIVYYDNLVATTKRGIDLKKWLSANVHAVVGKKIYLPAVANAIPQFGCELHLYKDNGATIISRSPIIRGNRILTGSTNNLLLKLPRQTPDAVRVRVIENGKGVSRVVAFDSFGVATIPSGTVCSAFGIWSGEIGTGVFAKGGPVIDEPWMDPWFYYDED